MLKRVFKAALLLGSLALIKTTYESSQILGGLNAVLIGFTWIYMSRASTVGTQGGGRRSTEQYLTYYI